MLKDGPTATWDVFAKAEPRLAERGARLLGVGHAYIATTVRDGSPRVHPVTPLIAGGRLLAIVGVHTAKYRALLRDPRFALHAVLGESDEEFMLAGTAVPSDDWASRMLAAAAARQIGMTSRDDVLFEFRIDKAHWAIWEGLGTPDMRRRAETWRAADAMPAPPPRLFAEH